jgi:diacylglycerol kinase (ATP)
MRMKNQPFHARIGYALAGWRAGWRREASFRAQAIIAGFALFALLVLRPAPVWWALVAICVALVLVLELVNSAVEAVIDLLHPGIHAEIKAAKDMLAGAVLLMSSAAVAVGAALVAERLPQLWLELGL